MAVIRPRISSKMGIFLDDMCQVNFPGDVIYGVFCSNKCIDPDKKPIIKAIGCTLIWKPGTKEEVDECSTFYEDRAKLSPGEVDNSDVLLSNKYKGYKNIFMFHLVLPNNLPPSHEVPFGYTRYKLEACYDGHHIASKFFSVNQWVGLEKRNNAVVKRSSFPVSLFSFCSQVQIVLNLDQSNYLPGETVYIGAIIKNDSWRDVLFTQICIIQTTKYWKTHRLLPMKYVRIIEERKRGYIHSGEEQVWNKHPIYIPAVIPTTHTSNNPFNYFKVEYKIKILVTMINLKKIEMKQKICIGNWDKSIANNIKQCIEILKKNDPPYVLTTKEATLGEENNIGFIPKYMLYETSVV